MSKEFNYERAWREYVKPEFKKIYPAIKTAFNETLKVVHDLSQVGASHQLTGQSIYLTGLYDAIDSETLAWASKVVYYYGHLSPEKTAQESGLYWKFQILADESFFKRKERDSEIAYKAKIKMEQALKAYHDHEEGTEYDDEEIPEYIQGISPNIGAGDITILKVKHVNHKPDQFCIDNKHIQLSQGILDPRVAPCAHCGQDYDSHTSDRVMFVKVHNEDKTRLQEALLRIKTFLEDHKIKIDGFAMVKV